MKFRIDSKNGATIEVWEWMSNFIPLFIIINNFNKAQGKYEISSKGWEKSGNFFLSTIYEVKI